jgi:formate/nitrite transporter
MRTTCVALALFAASASGAALVGRRSAMVGRPSVRAARVAPPATMAAAVAGEMSVVACKTPAATFEALVDKGVSNSKMSFGKVMFSSITGGCFVGMGGLLSVAITGAMPGVAATNPGLIRFVFAALFPVNLLLVLQTGAQLFTGNTASLSAAFVEGKVSFFDVMRSWTLSFIGNVIGCGLLAWAAWYTGILSGGAADMAAATVMKKCSMDFGPTFVKAVLCNWLVCLAVFLATQAQDMAGKMVGIWFPISTFVAIGFEHSVANMFLLPLGLLAGAKIGIMGTIMKNLIPVTLGNAFAGAVIVGAGFSYLHGSLGKK